MLNYILRRVGVSLITIFVIATLIFLFIRTLPGDPARLYAGQSATLEDVERLRRQMGLDKPLGTQYFGYVKDLLRLDMGKSLRTQQSVLKEIGARLPATAKLATLSIIIAAITGISIGVFSAIKRYSISDTIISIFSLIGVAMPVYWLGLELIVIFAVKLKWLPAGGSQDGIKSLILPSLTLAAFSMAMITRMTRATMLEIMNQDFTIAARAKGLVEWRVILQHTLRNALIPVVTVVGLQFGALLGGSILTETIFAWPGIGRLLIDSLTARDYPMIQGLVIVFASLFIFVNLCVDLLYGVLDPRVQYD